MGLRDRFDQTLTASMKARNAARTSTLRMIKAKLQDVDIASRPRGVMEVSDDEIMVMMRGMVKSRRESVEFYRQGHRPELAAKEEAEIAVIEEFLPSLMDDAALYEAVESAIASSGATSAKEMGKVVAALRSTHGVNLDMSRASVLVKKRLAK